MLAQTQGEWVECKVDSDYEIYTTYPYDIRKKSTGRIVSESLQSAGYPRVKLNGADYLKHRIVAIQFIPNDDPEHKTQVDHNDDHDRTNYHISNLVWSTPSKNNDNKTSYNGIVAWFSRELSKFAVEVTEYGVHRFESLWFDPESDSFWVCTGAAYRELNYHSAKSGSLYVQRNDTNHKRTNIYLDKFKQINKL